MAKKFRDRAYCGYCNTGELGMHNRWDREELAAAGWGVVTNTADNKEYYACPRCAAKLQDNVDHEMRLR